MSCATVPALLVQRQPSPFFFNLNRQSTLQRICLHLPGCIFSHGVLVARNRRMQQLIVVGVVVGMVLISPVVEIVTYKRTVHKEEKEKSQCSAIQIQKTADNDKT